MRMGTFLLGLCLLMWLSGCTTEKREEGAEKKVREAYVPEKAGPIKPAVEVTEEVEQIGDDIITRDKDYVETPIPAEKEEPKEESKRLTSEEMEAREQAAKEAAKEAEEAGDEMPKPKQEEYAPQLADEEEAEESEDIEEEAGDEVDEETEDENEDTETDDSENREEVWDKNATPPDVN